MNGLISAIKRVIGVERPRGSQRVLLAWEMGSGLGHIERLLLLGRALAERECEPVFALKIGDHAHRIREFLPHVTIVSAPHRQAAAPGPRVPPAHTYADLLHRMGYAEAGELEALVRAWMRLFERFKPDLIVCDHSPTVVLAAGGTIPVVHVGSGFATPPPRHRFVVLHEASARGAKERQAEVLASIRSVQRGLGRPPLENLTDLFASAAHHVACCLPELDPYRSARREPALGPLKALPAPMEMPDEPFVFGYLSANDVRTLGILEGLVAANVSAGFYVRDGNLDDLRRATAGSRVTLYDEPQPMTAALEKATAVVHHAGLSTAEQALAAGRPQFLVPRYLEQALTAEAVAKLGCGVNLSGHRGDLGAVVARAVKARTYEPKAQAVAQRIGERSGMGARDAVVSRCKQILSCAQVSGGEA